MELRFTQHQELKMNKYIKIFVSFARQNLSVEMEYRKNFVIRMFNQFLFVLIQVALINLYFKYTNKIGNWSKMEVFALAGIFRLIEGGFHILFHSNVLSLPEIVNRGELDLYLSKPINTLFIVSINKQQWYELSTFMSGVIMLAYSLSSVSVLIVTEIFLVFVLGLISLYSLLLFFACFSFYTSRLTAINSIWDAVSKISRFPLDIFQNISKTIFFLAPLFLVATLPAQIVLGKISRLGWAIQITGTILLFTIAVGFWNFSLKRYSSASS